MDGITRVIESGIYYALSDGSIFSDRFGLPKEIRQTRKQNGYLKFNARPSPNESCTINSHRFVWVYFNGRIPDGMEVNHINFDKTDNRIVNLELVSAAENMRHAVKNGRLKNNGRHSVGVGNIKAKLNPAKVIEIRRLLAQGMRGTAIAKMFKVGSSTIYDIKSGAKWGHVWQGSSTAGPRDERV
jgi:hypothetical protein